MNLAEIKSDFYFTNICWRTSVPFVRLLFRLLVTSAQVFKDISRLRAMYFYIFTSSMTPTDRLTFQSTYLQVHVNHLWESKFSQKHS